MRFNFIGQQASFGESITSKKQGEKDLLIPSPNIRGKRKKKALINKEVLDGSKK
jgi:hypothetical protein